MRARKSKALKAHEKASTDLTFCVQSLELLERSLHLFFTANDEKKRKQAVRRLGGRRRSVAFAYLRSIRRRIEEFEVALENM